MADGGGASVMCSYNAVNGVPSCANDLFQNKVMGDQWGFLGFIVSRIVSEKLLCAHVHHTTSTGQ